MLPKIQILLPTKSSLSLAVLVFVPFSVPFHSDSLSLHDSLFMESLSPATGSAILLPTAAKTHDHRLNLLFGSTLRTSTSTANHLNRVCKSSRVYAEKKSSNNAAIDYTDPDWKLKFQQNFESRFNIPHLTDVFPDADSYPSPFCLKMRYILLYSMNEY